MPMKAQRCWVREECSCSCWSACTVPGASGAGLPSTGIQGRRGARGGGSHSQQARPSWGKDVDASTGPPKAQAGLEDPRMEWASKGQGPWGPLSRAGDVRQGWILSLPLSRCDLWAVSLPSLNRPFLSVRRNSNNSVMLSRSSREPRQQQRRAFSRAKSRQIDGT